VKRYYSAALQARRSSSSTFSKRLKLGNVAFRSLKLLLLFLFSLHLCKKRRYLLREMLQFILKRLLPLIIIIIIITELLVDVPRNFRKKSICFQIEKIKNLF
jgi:hypothetical protein